ncbi:expansin-A12 [Cinnamomum micranthum f. kanehirae]|uniref:Expansin n=1 Tax=Cinnamomum micranthum f. kanehirae TaxID=337451 RepID=A0A3S4NQF3_9MAGN|nr:expansin-A12 [Cinnamomum micranthum f. kanehirae]
MPRWTLSGACAAPSSPSLPPISALPTIHGGWCDPPHRHFDMSLPAFSRIARVGSEGIIPVLYRRVPCKRAGGVRFTLKGQSNFNLVMISNVGGSGDVKAVQLKGSKTRGWVAMHRNWGANLAKQRRCSKPSVVIQANFGGWQNPRIL